MKKIIVILSLLAMTSISGCGKSDAEEGVSNRNEGIKNTVTEDNNCTQHPLYITYKFGYEKEKTQSYQSMSSQQNMALECTYSLNGELTLSATQIGCYLGWQNSSEKRRELTCGEVISYFRNKGVNVN